MGSCTGKTSHREVIKSKIEKDHLLAPINHTKEISLRKHLRQKAAVVDSRIQNSTYSEVPNAIIQDIPKTEQEVRLIVSSLKRHFIFSSLKPEYKSIMVHHMKHYFLNTSEKVFEQGQPGINFYVVASGKLEVIINNKQVATLKPGDSFGEMALIHDTPRTASVKTLEKSSLWGLDRKTFRKTLELLESVNYEENKKFIDAITIFETLDSSQKDALVHVFSTQYFNPSTKIIKEGDPGELLYIIKEGNVICTRGDQEIRRLGKGSYFGEQALIFNEMRTATVTAIDSVKCIAISGAKLGKVLGSQLQSIIYHNSIRMALEKNYFMKKLTSEQTDTLINNIKVKSFTHKSIVIPAGTLKSNFMWIVVKGALVKENNEIVARVFDIVSSESMVKELEGVFENNILAESDTDIAFIGRQEFNELLGGDYSTISMNNEALKVLKKVTLFRGLNNNTLKNIMQAMKVEEFNDSDVIVEQNELGDTFFIVKSGNVEAFKDGVLLRNIGKHDYFGERSLLFNDFRSASVKSKGKSACWKLLRSDFMNLIEETSKKHLLRRIELQDSSILLEDLVIIRQLGSGMFGNVFLTISRQTKHLYALKSVDRNKILSYELQESILLERRILLQLDHSFIMKLVKTFKDSKRLYFLLEFIDGTDLFEVIRKLNLLSEKDSQFYTACIIDILEHLHERDIIYRDLKPENIVVDEDGYPKLIDFGTAKFVKGRTYTIIGTPHYMAPEVVSGHGYGLTADYWTVGVMLFEFLFGLVPFGEDEEEPYAIYQKVQEHKLEFPAWTDKKSKAKDIITQLLSKNPAKRLGGSIENLKGHSWFIGLDWDKLLTRAIKPPYVPPMKSYGDLEGIMKNAKSTEEIIAKVESGEEIPPPPRRKASKVPDNWDEEF